MAAIAVVMLLVMALMVHHRERIVRAIAWWKWFRYVVLRPVLWLGLGLFVVYGMSKGRQ